MSTENYISRYRVVTTPVVTMHGEEEIATINVTKQTQA